jgi:hypothetical protein
MLGRSCFPGANAILACLFAFILCGCDERMSATYPNWAAVTNDNAVARGWLPEYLPLSSTNIVECHDLDTNLGAFALNAPPDDLRVLMARLTKVPQTRHEKIAPPFTPKGSWWPTNLQKGDLRPMEEEGFFVVADANRDRGRAWFFAIKPQEGRLYGWHHGAKQLNP